MIMRSLNKDDDRPIIPLGHGDPSAFPCFRTSAAAEDAVVDALRSARYNSYSPTVGILPARRYIHKSTWITISCYLFFIIFKFQFYEALLRLD